MLNDDRKIKRELQKLNLDSTFLYCVSDIGLFHKLFSKVREDGNWFTLFKKHLFLDSKLHAARFSK